MVLGRASRWAFADMGRVAVVDNALNKVADVGAVDGRVWIGVELKPDLE